MSGTPLPERKAILNKRFARTLAVSPMPSYRCRFVDLQRLACGKGSGDGLRIIDLAADQSSRLFEIRHRKQVRGKVVVASSTGWQANHTDRFHRS